MSLTIDLINVYYLTALLQFLNLEKIGGLQFNSSLRPAMALRQLCGEKLLNMFKISIFFIVNPSKRRTVKNTKKLLSISAS